MLSGYNQNLRVFLTRLLVHFLVITTKQSSSKTAYTNSNLFTLIVSAKLLKTFLDFKFVTTIFKRLKLSALLKTPKIVSQIKLSLIDLCDKMFKNEL